MSRQAAPSMSGSERAGTIAEEFSFSGLMASVNSELTSRSSGVEAGTTSEEFLFSELMGLVDSKSMF
ncbi:CLUMA_CG017423, isoform A, partial [Clunio marinus]